MQRKTMHFGRASVLATLLVLVAMTGASIMQLKDGKKTVDGGTIVTSIDKTLQITINNDDNWTDFADSGNGSVNNPWVLNGFNIDLGGAGIGMNFTNCTEYGVIRNSTVTDTLVYSIYMVDSANVDFENITLDGCAATMFYGDNVTNVTINDAVLYNANIGIDIDIGENIVVSNTSIDLMITDGIDVYDTWGLDIEHVNITNVGFDALYCDSVDGGIIGDMGFENITDSAIYIDDSTWLVVSDVLGTNTSGITMLDSSDLSMMTVLLVNTTGNGLDISTGNNCWLDDIEVDNANGSGIALADSNNCTLDFIIISDDDATDTFNTSIGIDFDTVVDVNVTFAIIENMDDDGIAIWNSSVMVMEDLWIRNFGDEGIVASGCAFVSVDGFYIYDDNDADSYDSFDGFYITDCLLVLVGNGEIENMTFSGIYIDDSTDVCIAMTFSAIDITNCNTSILVTGEHYEIVFYGINTLYSTNAIVVVDGEDSEGIFFIEVSTYYTTGFALEFADVANITCENVTLDTSSIIVLAIGLDFENVFFMDNVTMWLVTNMSFTGCTFDEMDIIELFTMENVTIVNSTLDLASATLNMTTFVNMTIQHSLFYGMDTVTGNASAAGLNFTNNAYSDYFATDFGNQVDPSGWNDDDILPLPYERLNDTIPFYSVLLFAGLVPTAHYAAMPSTMYVGTAYTFTFDGTYGDGTNTVTWSFGDQTPVKTGASINHVFMRPGTYTVSVTVVDGTGDSSTYSTSITIRVHTSGGGGGDDDGDGDDGGLNLLSSATGETTFITACIALGAVIVLYAMYQKNIFAKIGRKLRLK